MPHNLSDEKSTLVQVMTWCRQATSLYQSQWWPRSMSSYGVTKPKWVKPLKCRCSIYMEPEFGHQCADDVIQNGRRDQEKCRKIFVLIRCSPVTPYGVCKLCHHWCKYWPFACSVPNHYLAKTDLLSIGQTWMKLKIHSFFRQCV